MCGTENMIENISLMLTAFATFCAALAAWFSYSVSKNSLDFQKSYAENQNLINNLHTTITKARVLRTLISNAGDISDDDFQSMEPLLLDIRSELQYLNNIGVIDYQSLKIYSVDGFGEMVDNVSKGNTYLSDVIEILEQKLSGIFK